MCTVVECSLPVAAAVDVHCDRAAMILESLVEIVALPLLALRSQSLPLLCGADWDVPARLGRLGFGRLNLLSLNGTCVARDRPKGAGQGRDHPGKWQLGFS